MRYWDTTIGNEEGFSPNGCCFLLCRDPPTKKTAVPQAVPPGPTVGPTSTTGTGTTTTEQKPPQPQGMKGRKTKLSIVKEARGDETVHIFDSEQACTNPANRHELMPVSADELIGDSDMECNKCTRFLKGDMLRCQSLNCAYELCTGCAEVCA